MDCRGPGGGDEETKVEGFRIGYKAEQAILEEWLHVGDELGWFLARSCLEQLVHGGVCTELENSGGREGLGIEIKKSRPEH